MNPKYHVGQVIDQFNGVEVYYNGGVNHVSGRNLTRDGYNLGLSYQCVEFVKRYYFDYYNHRMPDTYGHAKSFFDESLTHGGYNKQRGLVQYKNGFGEMPQSGDIVVYQSTLLNPYGHVAIVVSVSDSAVNVVQQNAGPYQGSRATHGLVSHDSSYYIDNKRILGWLRLSDQA